MVQYQTLALYLERFSMNRARVLGCCVTLLLFGGFASNVEAGPLLDWLMGKNRVPANPQVAYMPATQCQNCTVTCQRQVVNYVPQTSYRTNWVQVPVTTGCDDRPCVRVYGDLHATLHDLSLAGSTRALHVLPSCGFDRKCSKAFECHASGESVVPRESVAPGECRLCDLSRARYRCTDHRFRCPDARRFLPQ